MKRLFPLFLGLVLLSACAHPVREPSDVEPKGDDDSNTEVPSAPMDITLQVGLIALEDNGKSGPLVGCGDSLVFVNQTVTGTLTAEEKVQAALEALFAIKDSTYGESGLYNALDEAELTVDSVHLEDSQLDVALSGTLSSGGVCDDPRIVEQIKETAENNAGVDSALTVKVTINGKALEEQLSGK